MTTLKSIFALALTTIFLFTSCQKDEMQDLDRQVKRSDATMSNETFERPPSNARSMTAVNMVDESARTYDLIGAQIPNENARGAHACRIKCSTGVVFDSNRGASNHIDARTMKCQQNGSDNFKGGDKFYYFKAESGEGVEGKRRYTITLSDLEDDLDLFVYTLDESGYIRECKGVSITIGAEAAEAIELTGLNEGYYLIVVDGWMEGITSSYALELICDVVTEETPCWDVNGNGKKDQEEDVNIDHIVNEDDCVARSIKAVSYEDDGALPGELTGTFEQEGMTIFWTEKIILKSSNTVEEYYYEEVGRDQWTIYLRDGNREVTAEIDVAHNQVTMKMDGNGFASYRVTKKSFHPGGVRIKGHNLTQVSISNSPNGIFAGGIEQIEGTDQWRQYDTEGIFTAFFREVTRDEWSVYLREEGSDKDIRLDTYNREVNELKINWNDLYHIVSMK
jgi:hypothetical protein